MTINGINGANAGPQSAYGMGKAGAMDSACRDIQKQIEQAEKRLQELASNEDMPLEQKMQKRQEIQKEITELNQQLRQRQMEIRQQERQKMENAANDASDGKQKEQGKAKRPGSGMSGASMEAMISADVSMKQAEVQGSVATRMEGQSKILESEIRMDKSRGLDTSKKEEALANLQKNIQDVTSSQMKTLADANTVLRDASKTEAENKADRAKEERNEEEKLADAENRDESMKASEDAKTEDEISEILQQIRYTPVDVRL